MKLATVAVYYEPIKAWIDMNLLESEGVQAVMENESLLQNVWLLGEAAGQIRLMVAEGNSENACRILENRPKVDLAELDELAMESAPDEDSKPLFQYPYLDEIDNDNDPHEEARTNEEDLIETASDPELNARELLIDRALRGSLVTFFFLPISILVAYLLFRIMISDEAVRPKYRQKLIWTSVLNVPVFLVVVFVIREMLQLMLLQ